MQIMRIAPEVASKYPELDRMVEAYSSSNQQAIFWEDRVYSHLSIVDARPNSLVWEFEVEDKHCNQLGGIHGGCVATIIDICSSFAILVYEGKQKWGLISVSTDLGVSYMRRIPAGCTARVECDVQRVGKTLANIYTRIYDGNGNLCYAGSHTKYRFEPNL